MRYWKMDNCRSRDEKLYVCTPYTYCINNPIKHVDPDGEFPWIAGLIGAGIDYMSQVAANKLQGKSWSESLTNVDKGSIFTSAITSMAGVGLANVVDKAMKVSKIANAGAKVVNVTKVAGDVAIDATLSATSQLIENGQVDGKAIVADVVAGQVGGKAGDYTKNSYQNSAKGKTYHRQADHDRRVAGNNPRKSRADRTEQSAKRAANYGSSAKEAVSTSVSNTASEVTKKIIDTIDDKNK